MVIAWAPRWEKKEKKIGVAEKKIGEPSEPRDILAEGSARLALMAVIYFFLFDPVFCLPFSPTAESGLRPYGYD